MQTDQSTLYLVSRLLTWIFSIYVFVTLCLHDFPNDIENAEVITFLFMFFWNFGVQWACFRMMHLCNEGMEEQCMFILQFMMMGWMAYHYRFVYNDDLPYNSDQFTSLPLQQYGVVLVLLLFFLVRYNKRP